jgi:hypothetical protein
MMLSHFVGCGYGVKRHFQSYLSYIMAVSFIGDENRRTEKTTDLSQVTENYIKLYRVHHAMSGIRTHNDSGNMH